MHAAGAYRTASLDRAYRPRYPSIRGPSRWEVGLHFLTRIAGEPRGTKTAR